MNSFILFFVSHLVRIFPITRCWKFKRILYRFCGVSIMSGVKICSNVTITGNEKLFIDKDVWIGHEVLIVVSAEIHIGANVNIAPRVYIGTGSHEIDPNGLSVAGRGSSFPITIGDGAWICAGSYILPGVSVGKHSIIAAGSVVTRDIPDGEMWGGVPARFIRKIE